MHFGKSGDIRKRSGYQCQNFLLKDSSPPTPFARKVIFPDLSPYPDDKLDRNLLGLTLLTAIKHLGRSITTAFATPLRASFPHLYSPTRYSSPEGLSSLNSLYYKKMSSLIGIPLSDFRHLQTDTFCQDIVTVSAGFRSSMLQSRGLSLVRIQTDIMITTEGPG